MDEKEEDGGTKEAVDTAKISRSRTCMDRKGKRVGDSLLTILLSLSDPISGLFLRGKSLV